jgi:SAM-dependent methyltransferase
MKRVAIDELLDTDSGSPEEVMASIRDLVNINRWFGGISSGVAMLEKVAAKVNRSRLSVLEVASGSGEVSRLVAERLAKKGIELEVTLMDRVRSHLGNHFSRVTGDAVAIPFRDNSFDVVSCNLFAHHLSAPQLLQFAREGVRVSRAALLINDVVRNPLHLMMVYAGLPLFRSRLTWHDAPASVRQAYTVAEMRDMLRSVPNVSLNISPHYLFRMNLQLWKLHA